MCYAFPQAGLDFLRDLSQNNTKEWFHKNKKRYEQDLKNPARALVAAINEELERIAPEYVTEPVTKALNRINRDIRFSKDKTPYNTKVWTGFSRHGTKKGVSAGFYFGFSLDGCGVGAGLWMPPKQELLALRAHFAEYHAEYNALVGAPEFSATFEQGAELYKRVPKPYPADHPAADLLKLKGVHLSTMLELDLVTSKELIPTIGSHFELLVPVVTFLNQGLDAK